MGKGTRRAHVAFAALTVAGGMLGTYGNGMALVDAGKAAGIEQQMTMALDRDDFNRYYQEAEEKRAMRQRGLRHAAEGVAGSVAGAFALTALADRVRRGGEDGEEKSAGAAIG